MEEMTGNDDRWGRLFQEGLVEIFSRLPFEDRLRVIPLVCKSWRTASYDPTCWTTVNMEPWMEAKADVDLLWDQSCEAKVDHLVKAVVDRSCGQLRQLRTMHVTDEAVEYIAEKCASLVLLSIRFSPMVTDRAALKLAATTPKLELLDVSDCQNISKHSLDAFGRSCPCLTWLGRNMLSRDLNNQDPGTSSSEIMSSASVPGGDGEVEVMSKSMGRLKHLELRKGELSDRSLEQLVLGCRELENLDLACCTRISPKALTNARQNSPSLRNLTQPIAPRMNVVVPADNMVGMGLD